VVRGEPSFELLALPAAFLAAIAISLEHGIAPSHISLVPKALPRMATLPPRVPGAAQDGATLEFCSAGLGDRLRRDSSTASLCAESRSLLCRELALARVRALDLAPVIRILVKLKSGSPSLNAAQRDAKQLCEVTV
jgi:hypothetical protein